MQISLTEVYNEFWSKFVLVVRDYSCYPSRLDFNNPTPEGNNEYKITLKEPICLMSWPCHRSKTAKVHIIINFEELYKQESTIEILQSYTHVYYCWEEIRNDKKELKVESVSFEFHPRTGGSDGDPILHSHIHHSVPEMEIPDILKKKLRNKPGLEPIFCSDTPTFLGGSRIPTIQMSLPGVLCFLVADHLRGGIVKDVICRTDKPLENMSKYLRKLPKNSPKKFWDTLSVKNWYNY